MKESISIKNLGPIKNIYIDEIKPFTILIGESGSGKSTLMKVIALFRWLYKQQNIASYLEQSNIPMSFLGEDIITYIKNCGLEQFIQHGTKIDYKIISNTEQENHIVFEPYGQPFMDCGHAIYSEDILFGKIAFISELRTFIPHWLDNATSIKGGSLGFYFHEVLSDFGISQDAVETEIKLPFGDLNFQVKKTANEKKYTVSSTGNNSFEIDYKNSSSGIQNAVPILLITEHLSQYFSFEKAFNRSVLSYLSQKDKLIDFKPIKNLSDMDKKIYIHIEEPELSLYPDAQCGLMDDLIKKCFMDNKNDIELFVSTHSPYIINHLNLLIKKFDKNADGAKYDYDDLAVYQVCDGGLENLKIQNERLINTNPLSETIDAIYDKYAELG
jgi:predicted ATPase